MLYLIAQVLAYCVLRRLRDDLGVTEGLQNLP